MSFFRFHKPGAALAVIAKDSSKTGLMCMPHCEKNQLRRRLQLVMKNYNLCVIKFTYIVFQDMEQIDDSLHYDFKKNQYYFPSPETVFLNF